MKLSDLYSYFESNQRFFLLLFVLLPVFAYLLKFITGPDKNKKAPWNYVYTVVIYMVTIPGVLQFLLTGYLLFAVKENLMNLSIPVYILPIISMIITLVIVSKTTNVKTIPGFGRLSGLLLMTGISIVLVGIISKTQLWLFFGGSIFLFFGLIVIIILLIWWGWKKMTRKK